jgi:hypothetical protein
LLEKLEPEKLTFTTSPFVLEKETEEREMASTNNTLNSNISGEAGTRIIAARITKTALLSPMEKKGRRRGVGKRDPAGSGGRSSRGGHGREIVCGHTGPGTDGWGLSLFIYIGSSQPMKVTVLTSVNPP